MNVTNVCRAQVVIVEDDILLARDLSEAFLARAPESAITVWERLEPGRDADALCRIEGLHAVLVSLRLAQDGWKALVGAALQAKARVVLIAENLAAPPVLDLAGAGACWVVAKPFLSDDIAALILPGVGPAAEAGA
jgi:ActR/RegA family two-component response regulator